MAEAVKPRSITFEYLREFAKQLNIVGVHPIVATMERDKWIVELDGYIDVPECFEDNTSRDFAMYIRRRL